MFKNVQKPTIRIYLLFVVTLTIKLTHIPSTTFDTESVSFPLTK